MRGPWRRLWGGGALPFVPAMEAAECGVACLAMILASAGRPVPLSEMRRACGSARDGASAAAIVQAARSFGAEATAVRLELDALCDLPTPCILHWGLDHFVVLERFRGTCARILDPAVGRRKANWHELDRMFTGVALLIDTTGVTPLRGPAERRRRLPGRTRLQKWEFVMGALAYEALAFAIPCLVQLITDDVARPRIRWGLPAFGAALVVGIVAKACLDFARKRLNLYADRDMEIGGLRSLLSHMLSLPTDFFVRRMSGELVAGVDASLQQREALAGLLGAIVDGSIAVGYVLLIYLYAPLLAGVVALVPAVYTAIVLALWVSGYAREILDAEVVRGARLSAIAAECIASPEATQAFDAFGFHGVRYTNAVVERSNAAYRTGVVFDRLRALWMTTSGLASIAILTLGGRAVLSGELTIGRLMASVVLLSLIEQPVSSAIGGVQKAAYIVSQSQRVTDVLDTTPERSGGAAPPDAPRSIRFEGVSFRYDPRSEWILRNVSFELRAGEHLALVGASGSGKTTILRLLLGLYEPTVGTVRVDGIDLREMDAVAWRNRLGVVLQESQVGARSVRGCVALDRDLDDADVWSALQAASLDEWVASVPGSLDAPVGEQGRLASAGQRQRLALAAAFSRRPAALVLDEATSSLDPETENRVFARMNAHRCPTLSVVHRASGARAASRILVLEKGLLVQSGTFAELELRPGPFLRLFSTEGRQA